MQIPTSISQKNIKLLKSADTKRRLRKETYISITWQKLAPATEQLQITLFSTTCGIVGVTQLGLLLHGSMSKFQSFLPSDLAITLRAFSKYT